MTLLDNKGLIKFTYLHSYRLLCAKCIFIRLNFMKDSVFPFFLLPLLPCFIAERVTCSSCSFHFSVPTLSGGGPNLDER